MTHYSSLDCKGEYFEDKLDKIFKQKYSGVFVELGAHNGLIQSNTAFFEFNRGWRGILIEPSTNQYEECKKNRPNSFVLNYACVSNEYQKDTIEGDFIGGMMSSVNAERTKRKCDLITIKATTLEKIFDEYNFKEIDFLSLDTEGYELNILKGINFSKYRPKYILIEIYNYDYQKIYDFMISNNYKLHSNFSNYNHVDNPTWDGSHNDYLFESN